MISSPGNISITKESGQASGSILFENVVKMARLIPTSWPRAIWVAASDAVTVIAEMALRVGIGG